MSKKSSFNICIIGLGYVGLPLAVEFGKKYSTIGFDINNNRIQELIKFHDSTLELSKSELKQAKLLEFTSNIKTISTSNIYIVTVPTPITRNFLPDLNPLKKACRLVASVIKKNDFVIFESTVFPGATANICVPILESSGLKLNLDFSCGYSPERINPGDKTKRLKDITKVVSASNKAAEATIHDLYSSIISADIYLAESIEVAEAAKVIENTQRDINIALMNELSIIFDKLDLDTNQVLRAARSKWNFIDFKPGLVGGHCIGVDPYYLTFIAKQHGYNPKVILSGRKTNNHIPTFIAEKLLSFFKKNKQSPKFKKILILGLTFKENCPDTRNSKIFDLIDKLTDLGFIVEVMDPFIDQELEFEGFKLVNMSQKRKYDGLILAVPHLQFLKMGKYRIKSMIKRNGAFFDLKGVYSKDDSDFRL